MTEKDCICESPEIYESVRKRMLSDSTVEKVAAVFKIFGDPSRVKILWALGERELCVNTLSETLGMTMSAVSHQLKYLKDYDLIKSRREGKHIYYSLCDNHVGILLDTAIVHISEKVE